MKKRNLIVFSMILILFLTGCGLKTITEGDNEVSDNRGIDLYGTYNENDLIIETLEKEVGSTIAAIPQINGLKDQEVQDKVNKDMYERVIEACTEIEGLNYVDYYTTSNFANVISISVYLDSDETYDQVYLNYNLVNGDRLTFEELFCEDTDTLEIIRNGFYESLVLSQMTGNIDENEYYKVVKSFSEKEEKNFAFTPSQIYMYYQDHSASVKMLDIAESIAIYSKYLTEDSLYEKDDIGMKNIMTCATIPENVFDLIEFGYLHENCWYDISIIQEYIDEDFPKEQLAQYQLFKTDRYDEFYAMIDHYGEEALSHPENFYIILSKPSFYLEADSEWNGEEWMNDYTGNAILNENLTVYEMPKELYDKIYKEKLLEAYRYDYFALAGGVYLEVTESDVKEFNQYDQKTYNYVTGKELYVR